VADRQGEITTLYNLARAQRNVGDLNDARSNIESSLKLIELLRAKIASRSLRASYLSTVYQHYEFYIDLLMRLHKQHPDDKLDRLALEISERARARTLVESLHESRKEINRGVDIALLAEEQRIREELNSLAERQMRLLNGISAPEQVAKAEKEIERLLPNTTTSRPKSRISHRTMPH